MGVSGNRGFPPNHPKSNGFFPLFSPSILGVPLFLETPIYVKTGNPPEN